MRKSVLDRIAELHPNSAVAFDASGIILLYDFINVWPCGPHPGFMDSEGVYGMISTLVDGNTQRQYYVLVHDASSELMVRWIDESREQRRSSGVARFHVRGEWQQGK